MSGEKKSKSEAEKSNSKTKKSKFPVWVILLIVLGLCISCSGVMGLGGYYLYHRAQEKAEEAEEAAAELDEELEDLEEELNSSGDDSDQEEELDTYRWEEESDGTGTIEGSLSYPSEYIPPEMQICAEDVNSSDEYCTTDHIQDSKYTFGYGYQLEVPYGSYYVYAYMSDINYKAYYNEFVECGMSVDCSDHTNILVTVDSFQDHATGVDPMDWYGQ